MTSISFEHSGSIPNPSPRLDDLHPIIGRVQHDPLSADFVITGLHLGISLQNDPVTTRLKRGRFGPTDLALEVEHDIAAGLHHFARVDRREVHRITSNGKPRRDSGIHITYKYRPLLRRKKLPFGGADVDPVLLSEALTRHHHFLEKKMLPIDVRRKSPTPQNHVGPLATRPHHQYIVGRLKLVFFTIVLKRVHFEFVPAVSAYPYITIQIDRVLVEHRPPVIASGSHHITGTLGKKIGGHGL